MGEKIVLIDGHSILNRTFYGLPDLTNAAGRHTNAVYGFLNILFRILEEEHPQYLAVAFDLHAPTFRHKRYAAYKGTRKPMPEELREQVPLMKEVLTAMGIRIVSMEGYEADDLLGTLARKGEAAGLDVTVLSGDRDLLQLATEKILIRIPKTRGGKTVIEDYRAEDVKARYGITPEQVIELKALMGDTADNIPGIPGVGEKTGQKIVQAFGTIENAYAHLEEVKPNKARESLREHYDLAVLSKELATIRTDSPVELNPEQSRIGNLFTKEAYSLFQELDFKKLLARFSEEDAKREEKTIDVRVLSDAEEAERRFSLAEKESAVGLCLLTVSKESPDETGADSKILGAALAALEEVVYVPVSLFADENVLMQLVEALCMSGAVICGMGIKEILHAVTVQDQGQFFDAQIAAYLLNPLVSSYPFDTIAREYGGLSVLSAEEIFHGKKNVRPAEMPETETSVYCGSIAAAALSSRKGLEEKLREEEMWTLFREIEMPLVFVLSEMERAGIAVKKEELERYGQELQKKIDALGQKIFAEAGETFNLNSPKQLGEILFEKMKLPGGKKTKTGYSTAAGVLEKLAPDVPFVADILEYRQLAKLKSTYADGLAGFIAADGRIHSVFHQTITATGRISSTEPNLQNIPIRFELGRQIRKVFVPAEGCLFLDADYSQIELRVLAHMAGDPGLIEAYREGRDIHAITASQVFHVPFEEVTPQQRRNAKAVNFGIVYGISSFGLSQGLSISRKEAAEYIENYFASYPGVKRFLDGLVSEAKEKGYSKTMYGRRRPLPEIKASSFMQRQFGERVAMNAPIQGTAADIIKIAMIRVSRRLKAEGMRSRLLLQVHDELLLEVPQEEKEKAAKILSEEMTGAADLAVRLEVDLHGGKNWYEAK